MKRKIIEINEELCDGCGLCIPACPEGALRVIDGVVRLLSDAFCDGLGACLGQCPKDAIRVVERDAVPYDERTVMDRIIEQGPNVIRAHLDHLADHGEDEYLDAALAVLDEKGIEHDWKRDRPDHGMHRAPRGCPGAVPLPSRLRQWPIQLHLVGPTAPYYRGADLLLAADCTAYAMGGFHEEFMKGRAIAIACPKLDEGREEYVEKLTAMIDDAGIKSITVAIMQVPCCGGLTALALEGAKRARRKVPMSEVTVGIQGEILSERAI